MLEPKNNVTYKIRTGTVEDAEAISDIENAVISEGEYFIVGSKEVEKTPMQKQRD